jgi:hypothetical protein
MQDIAGLFSEYSQTDKISAFRKHEFLFLRTVDFFCDGSPDYPHAPLAIALDISIRPLVVFNSETPKNHGKCAIAFSAVLNSVQDPRRECAGLSP